jgi:hypothetical protein
MAKSLYKIVHGHLADTHALYRGALESIDEGSPAHSLLKAAMEACSEKMEDCAKSEIADNLAKRNRDDALVPTQVSGVVPDLPASVRAVPRYGQRPISTAVPPEFERIFGLADLNSLD